MAASAFACTVRAASGQWAARGSIHAFTEGGTGAGWSGRLAWRLTGKKKRKKGEGSLYEARGLFRIFSGAACVRPPAPEISEILGPSRTGVSRSFGFLTGS